MNDRHDVTFHDTGRKARNPPHQGYEDGLHLDVSNGATATCTVDLPWPAVGIGTWTIRCRRCGISMGMTAAGRIDDPRQVVLACGREPRSQDLRRRPWSRGDMATQDVPDRQGGENDVRTATTAAKDWTGQRYDEAALADPEGGRADYDANLIRELDPRVSLNISGPVGSERPARRCRTGFVLTSDGTCEDCGAGTGEPCRADVRAGERR